jgi:hypothetical protein
MAGYSGTPLPKKLGIKENCCVAFFAMPAHVKTELAKALTNCHLAKNNAPLDFAMLFVKTAAELKEQFSNFAQRLSPTGMLWVSWPKKASGIAPDLDENKVRAIGLKAGLVDVKVCAVDETWSGLKFVIRVKDRGRKS